MTQDSKCNEDSMAPLEWNESFSVHAPVLDKQHKSLFDAINTLQEACVSGVDKDTLLIIIQQLYTYSTTHFRDEEQMLRLRESTLLEEQQNHHAVFLDYVIQLEARVKSDSMGVNEDILTFLKVWWEEHILKVDRKYSKLF